MPQPVAEWARRGGCSGSHYVAVPALFGHLQAPPGEQAMVVANEDSPVFLAGAFETIASCYVEHELFLDAFRTGEGIGWHAQDERLFSGVVGLFGPGYAAAHLVNEWLPGLDGMVDKLRAGAKVADVGCGYGASTIIMAQAFEHSTFPGFDIHQPYRSLRSSPPFIPAFGRDISQAAKPAEALRMPRAGGQVAASRTHVLLKDPAVACCLAADVVPVDRAGTRWGRHTGVRAVPGLCVTGMRGGGVQPARASPHTGDRSRVHPAAVALTVAQLLLLGRLVNAYGGLVDTARGVVCARCGGLVVVASGSSHPCGVYVQHGSCADCGVWLWRLLDERRVPVTDSRGRWMTTAGGAGHTAHRSSRRADHAMRPSNRPAQRADRTRPGC